MLEVHIIFLLIFFLLIRFIITKRYAFFSSSFLEAD